VSLQPPEPFTDCDFSAAAFVMFACRDAFYAFGISISEISQFASVPEKVTKIVSSNSIVSLVYGSGGRDRIMTFGRGMKKRNDGWVID
jgi:hypothetical protein